MMRVAVALAGTDYRVGRLAGRGSIAGSRLPERYAIALQRDAIGRAHGSSRISDII